MQKIKIKNISPYKHIIASQQFDEKFLFEVFKLTDKIKKNPKKFSNTLNGKIIILFFYEPSTRTRLSFESAVLRLGGKISSTENAKNFSSFIKGETIQDTITMLNTYGDFIILRHFEDDIFYRILEKIKIPYINAGSGKSQHPTQGLLDTYTIFEEFKTLENLNVCVCGDLLRGRTCNSLVYILSKFKNNKFYFVSPKNSKIKDKLKKYLQKKNIFFEETENLTEILKKVDVLYMTRIQKERFENLKEYEKIKEQFILDNKKANSMKKTAIIMHPLPRINEIPIEIDKNKRARYFKQAENAIYVRMAILKILNEKNP